MPAAEASSQQQAPISKKPTKAELQQQLKAAQERLDLETKKFEAKLQEARSQAHEAQPQAQPEPQQPRASLDLTGDTKDDGGREVKAADTGLETLRLRVRLAELDREREEKPRDRLAQAPRIAIAPYEPSGSLTLSDWLSLYEMATAQYTEAQRVAGVQGFIKDAAVLGRILSASPLPSSWPSMKTVILGDEDGDVQEQWEKVAQGNTESVDAYWSRFQAAFRACLATPRFSADEDRKIRLFKRGLQPRFRQHLSTCSYTTTAELKKLACAYEREAPAPRVAAALANVELQHSGAGSKISAEDPKIAAFACLHPDTIDAICEQADSMRIAPLRLFAILDAKSGVCHACGDSGHWKNECPFQERRHAPEPQQHSAKRRQHGNDQPRARAEADHAPRPHSGKRPDTSALDHTRDIKRIRSAPGDDSCSSGSRFSHLCRDFAHGHCNRGRQCKFAHDD